MPRIDFRKSPPLDAWVLLDTSLLLSALDKTHPAYSHTSTFLHYASTEVRSGRTILVATELAIEEAAHVITRAALEGDVSKNRYPGILKKWQRSAKGSQPFDWSALHKKHAGAVKGHVTQVRRFVQDVQAVPVQIIDPPLLGVLPVSLVHRMMDLMQRYGLLAGDAYHFAVADALGITMVATRDMDWTRAERDFDVLIDQPCP